MGWKKTLKQWEQDPQSIVSDLASFLNREAEKNRQLIKKRKTLTISEIEQLAEKFGVDPAYIQDGISKGRIIENDEFQKELEALRPGKIDPNWEENHLIGVLKEDGWTYKEIARHLSNKKAYISEEAVKKRRQRRKK